MLPPSSDGMARTSVRRPVTWRIPTRSIASPRVPRDTLGHVDILVNNAGVATAAPLARTTLDEWNRLLAINATGAFLCMQAFLPGMLSEGVGSRGERRVHGGADGLSLYLRVCGVQARPSRPDALGRRRGRRPWRDGECGVSELSGYPDDRGDAGARHRENRPLARGGARRDHRARIRRSGSSTPGRSPQPSRTCAATRRQASTARRS